MAGAAQPAASFDAAGYREWVAAGGFGGSVDLGPSNPGIQFLSLNPQWGVFLRPGLEYVLEGQVLTVFDPGGVLLGILPLSFRVHLGRRSSQPYFSFGAGLGWTNLTELEEIDRRFNFILQAGVGLRWPAGAAGSRHWLLEGRLHHISNSGTAGKNLGINQIVGLIGYAFM